MRKRTAIAIVIIVVTGVLSSMNGGSERAKKADEEFKRKYPVNGLTREQAAGIALYCAEHPEAFRCQ